MRKDVKFSIISASLFCFNCFAGSCEESLNICLAPLSQEARNTPDAANQVVATANTAIILLRKKEVNPNVETYSDVNVSNTFSDKVGSSTFSYDGKKIETEFLVKGSDKLEKMEVTKNDFQDACYEEYRQCVARAKKKK